MPASRTPFLLLSALCLICATLHLSAAGTESLWLGDEDRILVLAPHPGDETLSAGGLIQEALDLDLPVRVCFFTMGDNHEIAALFTHRHPIGMPGAIRAMGTLRQNEAIAAATQLGLDKQDLVFLGYPDSGTLDIWNHHWRDTPPLRSRLTKATAVPFEKALSTDAAYSGDSILDDLTDVIRNFRPTYIVLPHSADHNVDHRALALFARVALWNLGSLDTAPELLAAPIHFTQWPEPRRAQPQRPASAPYFLNEQIEWIDFGLASYQISNKVAALQRHHSQMREAPNYLKSFIRKSELFGDYPEIPFPGGFGSAEFMEEDTSQFRPDDDSIRALAQQSPQGNAIIEQQIAETHALQGLENDFLLQKLDGDGTELTLSFQFARPVPESATLTISLFAYQSDHPFGPLPKIVIKIRGNHLALVRDLHRTLAKSGVLLVSGEENTRTIRVPFTLLNNPEKILIGARLLKGSLPIDWTPWRILDCSAEPFPEAQEVMETPSPIVSEEPPPSPAIEPEKPVAPPMKPVAPQKNPKRLIPRVRLPQKSIPDRIEANEPVLW